MSAPTPSRRARDHEDPGRRPERADEREQASVGELVGQVSKDLSTLVRQEFALARAEATESAKEAGKGAGLLAGAASGASMTLLFLSLALWWALGTALGSADRPSLGASGLIVAAIWAVATAVLAAAGRARLRERPGLPRTAETVSKIPTALKGQEPS